MFQVIAGSSGRPQYRINKGKDVECKLFNVMELRCHFVDFRGASWEYQV